MRVFTLIRSIFQGGLFQPPLDRTAKPRGLTPQWRAPAGLAGDQGSPRFAIEGYLL